MATITASTNEKVYGVKKWLGLNECPDGDTRLKIGEASKMVNWKITRDGNLKRRPGMIQIADLHWTQTSSKTPIKGMWSGLVNGKQVFLAACWNRLFNLYDSNNNEFYDDPTTYGVIGAVSTLGRVTVFPFNNKAYVLDGSEYRVYDGTSMSAVEGYVPLVAITMGPLLPSGGDSPSDWYSESGETTGEYVNRLSDKRRVWLSPDGSEHTTFRMPEKGISIIHVKSLVTDAALPYIADSGDGTVTITTELDKGVNTVEVCYSKDHNLRPQVTGNHFSELYGGTTDTRIFIYGDGTNRALYSGMDYDGMPRADYFPDQYEVRVGDSNTPLTSMIRHYGTLLAYKPGECWNLQHGVVELADDSLTPAIYTAPVNKEVGNVAPGMVELVNNSPVTAFNKDLFQWTNSSYYTSNLSRDERQAKRISDKVQQTIAGFDLKDALMYDDNDHQEFYVVYDKKAIVWNYANDTWYTYDNFDAVCMCSFQGELYIGTSEGKIFWVTYQSNTDGGTVAEPDSGAKISAEWESGAMDFGAGHRRKYSSMLWVGLKPATGTSVDVCVETDRKNTFKEKIVPSTKAKVAGEPFMAKTKIKAKKFVYYRLLLSVDEKMPAVTVTDVEIRVRETGYAK